jgi:DNA-binding HxlR family transcriptional regulator
MFMGRHEYKDMLAAEEGISSNILTDRLKKLEQAGMIASAPHPQSKRRKLYYLTDMGKGLLPVLLEISRWSDAHLGEWVFIPDEKRAFLDAPPEAAREMILRQLSAWEDEFISKK